MSITSIGDTGTLWEGRYKAGLVESGHYLLACSRYIKMNPVRANMVAAPGDYRWSSYRRNGEGDRDEVVTEHVVYQGLGHADEQRQMAYRDLFRARVDPELIKCIRSSVNDIVYWGASGLRSKLKRRYHGG